MKEVVQPKESDKNPSDLLTLPKFVEESQELGVIYALVTKEKEEMGCRFPAVQSALIRHPPIPTSRSKSSCPAPQSVLFCIAQPSDRVLPTPQAPLLVKGLAREQQARNFTLRKKLKGAR